MTQAARAARTRLGLVLTTLPLVAGVVTVTEAAERRLTGGRIVDLGILRLRLIHNPGVAFSLGASLPTWSVLAVTGLITVGLAVYAWRSVPVLGVPGQAGLAAVLAGAMSNVVDRASDGVVTDYLHTGWFPTFNLADILVTIGTVLLVLTVLRPDGAADPASRPAEPA